MTKNLSILLIGINYAPEPTGIGKYTGELGTALAEKGYTVRVVTGHPYYPDWKLAAGVSGWWYRRETLQGARLLRCPLYVPANPSGFRRMIQDGVFFLSSLIGVTALRLKGYRPDYIFVASPSLFSGLVGLWMRWLCPGAGMVYHVQDLQVDAAEELGMIRQKSLLRLLKGVERFILQQAGWVTTISTRMQERISAKGFRLRHPVGLFPNWASTASVYPEPADPVHLAALGIAPNKPFAFYSGAMGEKQGLELVLDLAERAQDAGSNWQFVLAGNGPYAAMLAQQARDRGLSHCTFIPLQAAEVFRSLLNAASLHLVVQKEGAADLVLPSKLTNILAVGGLALVTALPDTALHDLLTRHQMGLVVAPGDLQAMWTAFAGLGSDPAAEQRMRQQALAYSRQYLQQESVISRFMTEWQQVHALSRKRS